MGFRISFKNNESLFFRVAKPNERKAWVEALERVRRRGVSMYCWVFGTGVFMHCVCCACVWGGGGGGKGDCMYLHTGHLLGGRCLLVIIMRLRSSVNFCSRINGMNCALCAYLHKLIQ